MVVAKDEKIAAACNILFGENFAVRETTIEYLQLSGIKHAFRERAKEFHPDINGDSPESEENFLKLKDAYDFLISVKSDKLQRKPAETKGADRVPKRKLRLGEYLYYSGKISWAELISAITWDRMNRNKAKKLPFGLYFVQNGLMTSTEMGFAVFKLKIHNSNY